MNESTRALSIDALGYYRLFWAKNSVRRAVIDAAIADLEAEQPDAPAVPSAEVVRFIRWFLNAHAFHLSFDLAYMAAHQEEVAAFKATMAWLSLQPRDAADAQAGGGE